MIDPDTIFAADFGLASAPATRATDLGSAELAHPEVPGDGSHQGPERTALVISQERVGRGFVVQSLRDLGLHTLIADSATHALSRLNTGHQEIDAIVIVGELPDGTAAALHRWARSSGHSRLPIIGVGVELGEADVWARALPTSAWFAESPSVLVALGILERRAAPLTGAGSALEALAA